MKQPTTIVLTGGGSGGHITPLLPVAQELKKLDADCQIVYIGNKGDKFDSLEIASDFDFLVFISGGKFRRYHGESLLSHLLDVKTLALNIRDFFRVIKSVASAVRILHRFKPDVVFSKGGFVVVPVGIAARILRIPVITHDSDAAPGLANRIIGRWAKVHATGMPAKFYPYSKDSMVYTGIPVGKNFKPVDAAMQNKFKQAIGAGPASQVLLVGGAGNGSKTINDLILSASSALLRSNPKLYIVHLTGQKHEQAVKDEYGAILSGELLPRVEVIGFTPELFKYSGSADLVVTRAGATTLAELAVQKKACIVIPSPFLAAGHQLENAKDLEEHGAAAILDNEVAADEFISVVGELLNDEKRRGQLAANLNKLAKEHAASKIAEIIMKEAKGSV